MSGTFQGSRKSKGKSPFFFSSFQGSNSKQHKEIRYTALFIQHLLQKKDFYYAKNSGTAEKKDPNCYETCHFPQFSNFQYLIILNSNYSYLIIKIPESYCI